VQSLPAYLYRTCNTISTHAKATAVARAAMRLIATIVTDLCPAAVAILVSILYFRLSPSTQSFQQRILVSAHGAMGALAYLAALVVAILHTLLSHCLFLRHISRASRRPLFTSCQSAVHVVDVSRGRDGHHR